MVMVVICSSDALVPCGFSVAGMCRHDEELTGTVLKVEFQGPRNTSYKNMSSYVRGTVSKV
jgi:hypothetical protein